MGLVQPHRECSNSNNNSKRASYPPPYPISFPLPSFPPWGVLDCGVWERSVCCFPLGAPDVFALVLWSSRMGTWRSRKIKARHKELSHSFPRKKLKFSHKHPKKCTAKMYLLFSSSKENPPSRKRQQRSRLNFLDTSSTAAAAAAERWHFCND